MEDGQIEDFTSTVHKMKDYERTAEKNKTQRANKADKKKGKDKEIQRLQKENKLLTANLAKSRMPFVEDKRGTEEEIDAESVQLYTTNAAPRKQRFGEAEKQQARAAFGRTLASGLGLGIKDRLGETRSDRELKNNFINKNNKCLREDPEEPTRACPQPIAEGDDGEWHYAEEEENYPGIDAEVAEVGYGSMDEDQDVYAHSA